MPAQLNAVSAAMSRQLGAMGHVLAVAMLTGLTGAHGGTLPLAEADLGAGARPTQPAVGAIGGAVATALTEVTLDFSEQLEAFQRDHRRRRRRRE